MENGMKLLQKIHNLFKRKSLFDCKTPDDYLYGDKKPTINQVAWVFAHLNDGIDKIGSFRYTIYDRMGFGPEAYMPLYCAGGMNITNAFCELKVHEEMWENLVKNKDNVEEIKKILEKI